ncbi:hypothetical protein TrRE_jg270 [Triparma retinervis]|uniref:Methyltransferase type 11 domain-containing protein n=1 Tax=Triparma retinervis TaxID=2557542 RepID=A0A9W7CHV3_9STRA|nr:hypothetical protein TrRE_jg270 [Triparma retinervis]
MAILSQTWRRPYIDPILVDPNVLEKSTAPPLSITTEGYLRTGSVNRIVAQSPDSGNYYLGTTATYLDMVDSKMTPTPPPTPPRAFFAPPVRRPNLPRWLSAALMLPSEDADPKAVAVSDDTYIPMRDLFTNPAVSFAYERGWRQGFKAAGFPGPDLEYCMVKDFFQGGGGGTSVVVDMSCGSGLMTRRLALDSDRYISRVVAADFSDSMLKETRRRYERSRGDRPTEEGKEYPRVDLVRADVARLPFRTGTVDCVHAGAAMHCWPDVKGGLAEIHRSLKPGGRYFASTFLAPYFRTVAGTRQGDLTTQSFQLFESSEVLRVMVEEAGFKDVEVTIEGKACAIIRAVKGEGGGEEARDMTDTDMMNTPNTSNTSNTSNTPSSLSPPNPPPFQ